VDAGGLKVLPVETSEDTSATAPNTIKIIPGQGFGTGHHPTTRMILETLSERAAKLTRTDLSIFDLGTGSGILAIAAAKLFNRPVEAVDNDPYAITNAADNVALNGLSHLISPSTTPIEDLKLPFNLIVANLYGEVLVQLAPEVTRLALPGCVAIMSGITELVRDSVVETYINNHGWVLDEEKSENGWHCVTLRRP
jgi:ribosomal protein L11 methyltransferase